MPRQFEVIIERDAESFYVSSVPQIPGCHTQARCLDEINERIRETIKVCLEVAGDLDQVISVSTECRVDRRSSERAYCQFRHGAVLELLRPWPG